MVMVTDSELYNVLGMTLVTDIVSLLTATLLVHSTSYPSHTSEWSIFLTVGASSVASTAAARERRKEKR